MIFWSGRIIERLEITGFDFLGLTSKRSYGRERRVNEKEIEKLMARYEPRLVSHSSFSLACHKVAVPEC